MAADRPFSLRNAPTSKPLPASVAPAVCPLASRFTDHEEGKEEGTAYSAILGSAVRGLC